MKKLLFVAIPALVIGISAYVIASGISDHSHDADHDHDGAKFTVGDPADGGADRVITVSMIDTMRFEFTPAFDEIHDDEVIEFIVKNDGTIVHEFSIGNAEDQVKHAEMMKSMHGMKHDDPNTVSLKPGETGKVIWRFKGEDTVVFACNELGHFEAGMRHDLKIGHSH